MVAVVIICNYLDTKIIVFSSQKKKKKPNNVPAAVLQPVSGSGLRLFRSCLRPQDEDRAASKSNEQTGTESEKEKHRQCPRPAGL